MNAYLENFMYVCEKTKNTYCMKTQDFSSWFKRLKPGSYLRELSIVVIGVAITLYAGGLISDIQEKKDLNLQLNAIYGELQDNLIRVNDILKYHEEHESLRSYLRTVLEDPEKYHNDSIIKYNNVLSVIPEFTYKKGAFDMFVNSGAMKLLSDHKQLLDITECYAQLEEFKNSNEIHFNLKAQIYSETYTIDRKILNGKKFDFRDPHWNTRFNFHTLNNGMADAALKLKGNLESILSKRKDDRK